jgi:P2 family phage contractile tail tube protein
MPAIQINKITNANVYVDGASLLGTVKEAELPKIAQKMVEHVALGLIGSFDTPAGVEKMESKITFNSFYADVMAKVANPTQVVKMQLRASLETYTSEGRSAQVPYVVFLTGTFKELPLGNFQKSENAEFESMFNVFSCKVEVNSVAVVEFDAFSNTYKVNGVDIAATYRANIGQ